MSRAVPWLKCRRGTAAVELALVLPLYLSMTGGLIDFGLYFHDSLLLRYAVQSAGQYAFASLQAANPTGVPPVSSIQQVASAASGLGSITVSVSAPGPSCFQDSSSPASLTSGSYGTACPNGNPVGTYVVITASYSYQPIMPLFSMLVSQTITASNTVRLY